MTMIGGWTGDRRSERLVEGESGEFGKVELKKGNETGAGRKGRRS